jgi:hypothetical protein
MLASALTEQPMQSSKRWVARGVHEPPIDCHASKLDGVGDLGQQPLGV